MSFRDFNEDGPGTVEWDIVIENISPVHKGASKDWFTFEQDGARFKAIINKKYRQSKDCLVVDVEQE